MQIICSKRLFFQRTGTEETFTVAPAPGPQEIPDWAKSDRTYKANVADGSIQELAISKGKPANKVLTQTQKIVEAFTQVEPVSVAANWPQQPLPEANGLSK